MTLNSFLITQINAHLIMKNFQLKFFGVIVIEGEVRIVVKVLVLLRNAIEFFFLITS